MTDVRIFRFSHGMDVIGLEVERPEGRAPPFYNTLWLKNARVVLYAPAQQQGVININFAPVFRVPAVVGIDEPDKIAPFNRDRVWTVETPNANILATYQKDTIGIFGPGAMPITTDLKQ